MADVSKSSFSARLLSQLQAIYCSYLFVKTRIEIISMLPGEIRRYKQSSFPLWSSYADCGETGHNSQKSSLPRLPVNGGKQETRLPRLGNQVSLVALSQEDRNAIVPKNKQSAKYAASARRERAPHRNHENRGKRSRGIVDSDLYHKIGGQVGGQNSMPLSRQKSRRKPGHKRDKSSPVTLDENERSSLENMKHDNRKQLVTKRRHKSHVRDSPYAAHQMGKVDQRHRIKSCDRSCSKTIKSLSEVKDEFRRQSGEIRQKDSEISVKKKQRKADNTLEEKGDRAPVVTKPRSEKRWKCIMVRHSKKSTPLWTGNIPAESWEEECKSANNLSRLNNLNKKKENAETEISKNKCKPKKPEAGEDDLDYTSKEATSADQLVPKGSSKKHTKHECATEPNKTIKIRRNKDENDKIKNEQSAKKVKGVKDLTTSSGNELRLSDTKITRPKAAENIKTEKTLKHVNKRDHLQREKELKNGHCIKSICEQDDNHDMEHSKNLCTKKQNKGKKGNVIKENAVDRESKMVKETNKTEQSDHKNKQTNERKTNFDGHEKKSSKPVELHKPTRKTVGNAVKENAVDCESKTVQEKNKIEQSDHKNKQTNERKTKFDGHEKKSSKPVELHKPIRKAVGSVVKENAVDRESKTVHEKNKTIQSDDKNKQTNERKTKFDGHKKKSSKPVELQKPIRKNVGKAVKENAVDCESKTIQEKNKIEQSDHKNKQTTERGHEKKSSKPELHKPRRKPVGNAVKENAVDRESKTVQEKNKIEQSDHKNKQTNERKTKFDGHYKKSSKPVELHKPVRKTVEKEKTMLRKAHRTDTISKDKGKDQMCSSKSEDPKVLGDMENRKLNSETIQSSRQDSTESSIAHRTYTISKDKGKDQMCSSKSEDPKVLGDMENRKLNSETIQSSRQDSTESSIASSGSNVSSKYTMYKEIKSNDKINNSASKMPTLDRCAAPISKPSFSDRQTRRSRPSTSVSSRRSSFTPRIYVSDISIENSRDKNIREKLRQNSGKSPETKGDSLTTSSTPELLQKAVTAKKSNILERNRGNSVSKTQGKPVTPVSERSASRVSSDVSVRSDATKSVGSVRGCQESCNSTISSQQMSGSSVSSTSLIRPKTASGRHCSSVRKQKKPIRPSSDCSRPVSAKTISRIPVPSKSVSSVSVKQKTTSASLASMRSAEAKSATPIHRRPSSSSSGIYVSTRSSTSSPKSLTPASCRDFTAASKRPALRCESSTSTKFKSAIPVPLRQGSPVSVRSAVSSATKSSRATSRVSVSSVSHVTVKSNPSSIHTYISRTSSASSVRSVQSSNSVHSSRSSLTMQSSRSSQRLQSSRSSQRLQSSRSSQRVQSGRSSVRVQSGHSSETVQSSRSSVTEQSGHSSVTTYEDDFEYESLSSHSESLSKD